MSRNNEIKQLFAEYGKVIDKHIKTVLPEKGEPLTTKWLNEPAWYHLRSGGKRLRPGMVLIVVKELGGDVESAMGFAIATELIHSYFLVHDDIEDGDQFRHDMPTVWVKYGVNNGINIGDYMMDKALRAVVDSPLPPEKVAKLLKAITLTLEKTGEGQALDLNLRADETITLKRYLEIVEGKTGYYFAFSFVGGAIIAGLPDDQVENLWAIGKTMGAAFQIHDDIIDLTEGKGRGGEVGSDIKEGKPSALFAYTLSKADKEENAKLVAIMKKPRAETTNYDVKWVIALYKKYNVIEYCSKLAKDLAMKSFKILDKMPIENNQVFYDLAKFVIERKV